MCVGFFFFVFRGAEPSWPDPGEDVHLYQHLALTPHRRQQGNQAHNSLEIC